MKIFLTLLALLLNFNVLYATSNSEKHQINTKVLSDKIKLWNVLPFKCSNDKSDEECMKIQENTFIKATEIFKKNKVFKDLQDKKVSVDIMYVGDEMPKGYTYKDIGIAYKNSKMIIGIPIKGGNAGYFILNEVDKPSDIYNMKGIKYVIEDYILIIAVPFFDK